MTNKIFKLFSFFLLLAVGCVTTASAALKPLALKEGDKVAIIAPGFKFDKDKLSVAIKRLESLGLKPIYDNTIFHQYGYFAGTDEERADSINKAIKDSSIKAIIAIRGGYGTANLLDKIDYTCAVRNLNLL